MFIISELLKKVSHKHILSRFVAKITDSRSLQWSLWTNTLTFQTPQLTVLFGPNADLEEAETPWDVVDTDVLWEASEDLLVLLLVLGEACLFECLRKEWDVSGEQCSFSKGDFFSYMPEWAYNCPVVHTWPVIVRLYVALMLGFQVRLCA